MQTLIDKVKILVGNTNIPTVGYKTMLVVLKHTTGGNFVGTKAEADALKNSITVNMSDNSNGTNPVALEKQYYNVRTEAGSANALLEIVLTKAFVASLVLPENYQTLVEMMTLPSNSEVNNA